MSLEVKLVSRLVLVALVSFLAAVIWILVDTRAAIRADLSATQARVSYQLERMHRLGSGPPSPALSPQNAIEIVLVMAPGTCVIFSRQASGIVDRRLCAGWNVFGEVSPGWFRKMLAATIGPFARIDQAVPIHGGADYRLQTIIDPVAAATRIWQQVRIASGLAAGLAGLIAILSAVAVARALKPVAALVAALRRIEAGELSRRLPRSGTREFDRIAAAIDDLASQLEMSLTERKGLMKRLFAVQEEERRRLARDLHDEFGQCLAAATAITASIEGEAGNERPRLAEDARTLARIHQRMMISLRSAFSTLRPPDIAELGIRACLGSLVREWNAGLAGRTAIRIESPAIVDTLPEEIATTAYRIVQEGLTNAAKHADARHVDIDVRIESPDLSPRLEIVVADDGVGGGNFDTGGSGLIGIRERVAALDGWLAIRSAKTGTRIAATIPLERWEKDERP
ncbi:histidine kinase [Aurantimonas sp. 22II-16-19i]|uniref:sensor histidine kinase n=1 Tax=Aurantimonas sp. 22II-16-19i TaxID=1317114 RepID=UPI0009F7A7C8|nr:histidine kinase [Aurantimonas sp. 22II-16-19i]ORE97449.1 integral membrane sensor signal transduction histidine kinase [Aurantimonas sp. 22II-16-19i]